MSKKDELKQFPVHESDEAAENFVDTADLSEYDFSGFQPTSFEFQKKTARLELRVPQDQMDALKAVAKRQGVPHARLVRQFIEQGIKSLQPRG